MNMSYVITRAKQQYDKFMGHCHYESRWTSVAGDWVWVCVLHDKPSKFSVEEGAHRPCLEVAPWR